MKKETSRGKIFVAYHKPCSVLKKDFIVPIYAGKKCKEDNKDSKTIKEKSSDFFANIEGDDTGNNISSRNNEFNECTVLYWAWKNVDYKKMDYIGLFQYRRQLILNDVFDKAKNDSEKKVYKCVHFKKITPKFCNKIGLTEKNILETLDKYDCIVPYSTDLGAMDITSPYEDWVRKIPGTHVGDLVMLEELVSVMHPKMKDAFHEYLNTPKKKMYHIFIAKPNVFEDYCEWLFNILFEIDKKIDSTMYSVNGKRTIGYLAEILYGFYFTYMNKTIKIKECGVSFIEK